MKEHESRKINIGEVFHYKWMDVTFHKNWNEGLENSYGVLFIDSNNFAHNLNGSSGDFFIEPYYIHGNHYKNKNEWEIEVNRLLMLEEL